MNAFSHLRFISGGRVPCGVARFRFQSLRLCSSSAKFAATTDEGKPTVDVAREQKNEYYQYSNEVLLVLAAHDDDEAQKERMLREIMAVDGVTWTNAHVKMAEINGVNREGKFMDNLPFKAGVITALGMGFASIPLCFDVNTALWFNDRFVTTDIPPPADLETVLETGMWTWGWMEPPLGQLSFLLLCLEFARAQLDNMGVRPYNGFLIQKRAKRLQERFPTYNDHILSDFSKNMSILSAQPEVKAKSDSMFDGQE